MRLDTPEKCSKAIKILRYTWLSIGAKGTYFEFHYHELRKLVKEFLQ